MFCFMLFIPFAEVRGLEIMYLCVFLFFLEFFLLFVCFFLFFFYFVFSPSLFKLLHLQSKQTHIKAKNKQKNSKENIQTLETT